MANFKNYCHEFVIVSSELLYRCVLFHIVYIMFSHKQRIETFCLWHFLNIFINIIIIIASQPTFEK